MNAVVEHLSNLIRIPSPSFLSNRPIIDYANRVLCQAQWVSKEIIYRDASGTEKINLISAPAGEDLNNTDVNLAFMCHTDTVPYSAGWPGALVPSLADSKLHGCGACDVKGFLACLLTAAAESDRSRLASGLRLILTADEEIGCVGAAHLVALQSISPRHLVVGEPTSLRPVNAGKGYCLAEVTVFGEEAHSAHPENGKSAIYRAARLISAIEEYSSLLSEEQDFLFSPSFTTLNIGTIQGGTAKNIVPGQCQFQLEWRPIPDQAIDSIPNALSLIADECRRTDPGFRCHLEILRQQKGFRSDVDSPLLRAVKACTGKPENTISFGSEASLMASMATDVIVFGPGDMHTAHSSRECVPVAELDTAVDCVKSLIDKNCSL